MKITVTIEHSKETTEHAADWDDEFPIMVKELELLTAICNHGRVAERVTLAEVFLCTVGPGIDVMLQEYAKAQLLFHQRNMQRKCN